MWLIFKHGVGENGREEKQVGCSGYFFFSLLFFSLFVPMIFFLFYLRIVIIFCVVNTGRI